MSTPNPVTSMTAVRATNRLIAAAIAHREAVRTGQGPSMQAEFLAAVDDYTAARTPIDAARDNTLVALAEAATALASTARTLRTAWDAGHARDIP